MAVLNWKRGLGVLGSVGVMTALLAGCGGGSSTNNATAPATTTASKLGGSITIDSTGSIKDLDPAKAYDTASDEPVEAMYDRLVTYQGGTAKLIGMAAKTWSVSPDGKVYTFNLNHNMKFWNGDPVTAQSFIDEFQRVLSTKVNSGGEGFLDPIVAGSTAYNKGTATSVSGLKAIDANTLQITLTQPEAFFAEVMAMPFFSAVDQSYINKVGLSAFDSKSAMGSGPFELGSVTPSQYVLTRNPHYWMKDAQGVSLPYLSQVTIRINANSQLDALNFEKGDTAFLGILTSGVPSSAWPQFQASPTLKSTIVQQPQNATFYIGFNNSMKPFNNVLVRQAMEYAIDKVKIAKLLNNRVQVANQPLPPGIQGYMNPLPADATYSLDLAKAKSLLTQAGFPKGFTTTLYSPNDSDSVKIDDSIQYDLSQIGVKLNIVPQAFGTFLTNNEKGNVTPIFQLAWLQDFPDASDFLNTLFNSSESPANNSTMYSNKKVDGWLNKAQTDTNQQERYSLYDKATEQIMKDADWDPMYYGVSQYAVQSWVHGFFINPTLEDPLQSVWLDKSHQ